MHSTSLAFFDSDREMDLMTILYTISMSKGNGVVSQSLLGSTVLRSSCSVITLSEGTNVSVFPAFSKVTVSGTCEKLKLAFIFTPSSIQPVNWMPPKMPLGRSQFCAEDMVSAMFEAMTEPK